MSAEARTVLAVELLEQIGLELVAASALVGMASRTAEGDTPNAEGLNLTRSEALGFSLSLRRMGDQLCKAAQELASHRLETAV